jgi:ABC-type transporter Mla maintaining outer membrane lipid asymmetry ATPase subunit MlaF
MNSNAPNSAAPIIVMKNVTVCSMRDPARVVAERVNWSVSAGDYWAIAGLQGTGKSDFLSTTSGLMGPREGSYSLFGESMPIFDDARLPTRLRLGLVFESGQPFTQLTVRENVALPLRYHHNLSVAEADDRVSEALKQLELAPWADTISGKLSRSWQKRVGLARALALRPQLLLIDNPIAGLDLRHKHWWLCFLDELSRGHGWACTEPMTLVVTTSDLRPWKDHARQFALLQEKAFRTLGSWTQLETASGESLRDFLTNETISQT